MLSHHWRCILDVTLLYLHLDPKLIQNLVRASMGTSW
jgi:hypothetical protein